MKLAIIIAAGAIALAIPSSASAGRKCIEVSDIVGEQKCSRYGDEWSVERKWPLIFRFGLRYGEFTPEGLTFKEGFKARDRPKGYVGYRFPGDALGVGSLAGFGTDGGFTFFLVGQLYLGIEGGLLLGSAQTKSFMAGTHSLSDAGGVDVLMLHGGVPIGYRIPLGRASLRGEVLFGAIIADVSQTDEFDGQTSRKSASAARGLIEPRIAGDIWFTQHVTFGAYAGMNMLDTGGHVVGLSLAWHNRAFDGDMSIW